MHWHAEHERWLATPLTSLSTDVDRCCRDTTKALLRAARADALGDAELAQLATAQRAMAEFAPLLPLLGPSASRRCSRATLACCARCGLQLDFEGGATLHDALDAGLASHVAAAGWRRRPRRSGRW